MSIVRDSQRKIVDYWYGKYILPDGRITEKHGSGAIPILIDKGELNCWACDMPEENCELQRCHILAESLGGEGYADNLFLMCERCHEESPDTTNRDAFFRWVYKKRKTYSSGSPNAESLLNAINEELAARGMMTFQELLQTLPIQKQEELTEMLTYKPEDIVSKNGSCYGFRKYIGEHTTCHYGKGRIGFNSIIIAYVDYLLECYYGLILRDYQFTTNSEAIG